MRPLAFVATAAIFYVSFCAVRALVRNAALVANVRSALRMKATWIVGLPAMGVVMLVGVPYLLLNSIGGDSPPPPEFGEYTPVPAAATTDTSSAETTSTTAPSGSTPTPSSSDTTPPPSTAGVGPGNPSPVDPAPGTPGDPATVIESPVEGSWAVGSGSWAGYRIIETVLGQGIEVAGSTQQVSGGFQIGGTSVGAVNIVVDMASVKCGCVHDNKYPELLATSSHPSSTFQLTQPIEIGSIPADGVKIDTTAVGNLTIKGVTRPVSLALGARREGARIHVIATIPVRLPDYGVTVQSVPGVGKVEDDGWIELELFLDRTG